MPAASLVVRFEVESVEPPIWRVVRVPGHLSLEDFHRVVVLVMGWTGHHPHAFEISQRMGSRRSAPSGGDVRVFDEGATIAGALAIAQDRLIYVHKAARDWRVRITRARGLWHGQTKSIICLDGYLAGPRDDCDGPAAYSALLAAALRPGGMLTAAQRARVGPDFDPERFDRCAINRALAEVGAATLLTAVK